jgi:hypothetical protein
MSIGDYAFISAKPSTIAYCSLMNTLQRLCIDLKVLQQIDRLVSKAVRIDGNAAYVIQIRKSLYPTAVKQFPKINTTAENNAVVGPQQKNCLFSYQQRSFGTSPRSSRVTP